MKNKILLCLIAIFSVAGASATDRLLAKPAPVITAGTTTGIISACVGSASVSPNIQQFTVSGNGLTANITATAPANFQVSLSAGSGYASSVTLTQSGGTVSNTVVYVRSAATAAVGNISGNVALSSAGATVVNAAVTGAIHALPTVGAVTNQALINGANTTAINFTGTGQQNWVNNTPGIGLPASGIGNIAPFTAVNTGAAAVTASITVTPNSKTSLYAYVGNALDGTVSVINTATQAVVATIHVGLSPASIAASPDASRVYVANFDGNSVSVINTATNTVVATVTVGTAPRGLVVSPNGSKVYVINGNTANVSVISTATNTVTATIPIVANPNGIAISPDGSKLYVANQFGNSVSEINTTTNTITTTFSANSGPYAMAISPDGSKLYVTNPNLNSISVIGLTLNNITNVIPVGTSPLSISASADGNRVYVANSTSNNVSVINTATNAVVATVPVGPGPRGISASPDGGQVYVPNFGSTSVSNNTVSIISTATNTVTKTVTVGNDPATSGTFITAGPGCSGTPTTFTITVNPSVAGAVINASGASGNILSCAGTPSASPNIQQFTVSGAKLTANITATAPAGFQVSLAAGSGYGSSVTLTQTAGTVNSTTIYVRSSASAIGHIIGNVALTSAGTTSKNVAVSATATPLPSVNPVSNQTVTKGAATTAVTFAGNASSYTWVNNTPSIGLAAGGTGNIPSFTAANPGASPLTATITVTPVPLPNLAYIANATANTVSVINTTTGATVATIPVGTYPSVVSVSPDGSRVYVANSSSNNISVINTTTNTVTATIPVGTGPDGICQSPDGGTVYVANAFFGGANGTISVINATTNTITATINVGQVPEGLIVSPDGSKLYVANSFSSNVSVVNTATNTVTATIPSAPGVFIVNAGSFALSPDGSILYVSGSVNSILAVVNTLTNTVVTTIPVAQYPRSVTISPDGSKVYIVSNGTNSVQVMSTATNTITATIPVGTAPWSANVSADGSKLYVTNNTDNTISVINTATNTVTGTINTGAGPTSLGNFLINGSSCPGTLSTFTITVNPPAVLQAPNITYAGPKVYTINQAITALHPTNTGGAVPATIYGKTTTVAGTAGVTGNANGTGTAASFKGPAGIVVDQAGNIYIGDTGNNLIRKITPAGVVTTFAGSGVIGSANGTGTAASFNGPYGITIDNTGNLYVADHFNNLIRKITPAGVVSTVAGSGAQGFTNGQGTAASFNQPNDIAIDAIGNLYIADGANYVVRKITPAGLVSTYAGSGVRGSANGTLTAASFDGVSGVTIDPSGNMFVVEGGVNRVRKITSAGVVSSFAGSGTQGSTDGPGATATFNFPITGKADAGRYVYIGGGNGNSIRKITPAGVVSTLAGNTFGLAGAADGVGSLATFQIPDGVAPDGNGNIYVADTQNALIRKVVATGYTISPALPAGLTFDVTTGIISGTPTAISPATIYTISAFNAQGGSTTTLSIQATASALQNQTITFAAIAAKTYGAADFAPGATASSGLAVTYASSNTAVATIVAGKIHIVGAGTANITASQAGNATYNPAPDVVQALTVNKANQTVTFAALAAQTYGAADIPLTGTATSGLAVTYASSNTAVATIVNGNIHIVGAGTTNITASQAGDANYNAATDVVRVLTVNKTSQTITFPAFTAVTFGAADIDPAATASSGLTVSYTSSNPAVATIVGGQVHIVGVGSAVITASQAGDANYTAAANAIHTLTVSKTSQTITFAPIGTKNIGAADFDPGATASSGLAVNYSSSNTAVATIVAGEIHIVAPGTTNITASQAGNADYFAAASVSQTLTAVKTAQTITFAAIGTKNIDDADFDPGASASSGLAVSYTSSNTAVATIVSGKIHIVGLGTSNITASQAGNAIYSAATSIQQVLTVAKKSQTISFASLPGKTIGDPDFDPGASASSGLAVSYASSNPSVATISGGQIHITGIGAADITASQAGDATYAAAADVTHTLNVADVVHSVTVSHPVVTPNGDVINQVLKFDGLTDFPDNKVVLVNANGVKIFEQKGYNNGSNAFDGHSNITGTFQQQGTYFYMVEYNESGVIRRIKGYFVLKY